MAFRTSGQRANSSQDWKGLVFWTHFILLIVPHICIDYNREMYGINKFSEHRSNSASLAFETREADPSVIVYQEDFVGEDDSDKAQQTTTPKGYKKLLSIRHHDRAKTHFNAGNLHAEVIPLVQNQTRNYEHMVRKVPSTRVRRSVPKFERLNQILSLLMFDKNNYTRHAIKGNYFNTQSWSGALKPSIASRFGNENETDRVVWGVSFKTPGQLQTSPAPRRNPPPLIYDPNTRENSIQPVATRVSTLQQRQPPRRNPPPLIYDPSPTVTQSNLSGLSRPEINGRFHIGSRRGL